MCKCIADLTIEPVLGIPNIGEVLDWSPDPKESSGPPLAGTKNWSSPRVYSEAYVHSPASPSLPAPTGGEPLLVIKTMCSSIERNFSIRYASMNAWAALCSPYLVGVLTNQRTSPPRENNKKQTRTSTRACSRATCRCGLPDYTPRPGGARGLPRCPGQTGAARRALYRKR